MTKIGVGTLLLAAFLGSVPSGWSQEVEQRTVLKMNLQEFVDEVLQRNGTITMSRLDADIAMKQVDNAEGDFEPRFVAGVKLKEDGSPNTVAESMQRSFLPEFYERSKEYKVGLKKKVGLTGAQLEFESNMREINNNLQSGTSLSGEYKAFQGATLTQPLLKGAGAAATAHVRLAEGDADIAQEKIRLTTLDLLGRAIGAYFDVCWSEMVLALRQEAADVARRLLVDGRNRAKMGRAAESELLELLALVSQRDAQLDSSRQALVAAEDLLRNHLFIQNGVDNVDIKVTEGLESGWDTPLDPTKSMESAFVLRPELRLAKKAAEQENVRLVYLANQTRPQLDLVASYGVNGLGYDVAQSWKYSNDNRYKTWGVGVQMEVPLFGGQSAASQVDAAAKRKEKALLDIKNTEVQIANMVHTQLQQVENSLKEWQTMQRLTQTSRDKWRTALGNYEAGKGEYRDLLQQESLLKQSQEAEMQTLLRYRKAWLGLHLAEGSLLSHYGAEEGSETKHRPDFLPVEQAPRAKNDAHPPRGERKEGASTPRPQDMPLMDQLNRPEVRDVSAVRVEPVPSRQAAVPDTQTTPVPAVASPVADPPATTPVPAVASPVADPPATSGTKTEVVPVADGRSKWTDIWNTMSDGIKALSPREEPAPSLADHPDTSVSPGAPDPLAGRIDVDPPSSPGAPDPLEVKTDMLSLVGAQEGEDSPGWQ